MHSQPRPRGKIFFEAFCAVTIGVSFVGAWVQTGAWAFLAPAFLFTLFGLYWSFEMFGRDAPAAAAVEAQPAIAAPTPTPAAAPAPPEPLLAEEIRFERFEHPVADPEPEPMAYAVPEAAFAPEPVTEAKPKRRARKTAKAAEPVVQQVAFEPDLEPEPAHHEPHIEQLFDPQPFARQARPAFGKRSRGPGPRPLPA